MVQRLWRSLQRVILLSLGFLLAIGLPACNPNRLPIQNQVSQLVDAVPGEPKTFNYVLSNESPSVFPLLYEGLITENPLTGEIEAALAESWQVAENKRQITYILKEGLKWSDGQPLTTDDVIFTYRDIYMNPEIPNNFADILKIGQSRRLPTVRKLDDRRIEFTTPEPFAPFLRTTGAAILPMHVLQKAVQTKDSKGTPLFMSMWGTDTPPKQIIANGPYTLENYVTSQRVTFRRNPYYWRKDAQGQSQPYIDRVVWRLVESRDTELLRFRSGELDISEQMRPEDFPLLKHEEQRGRFQVLLGGQRPMLTFMAFNQNKGRRKGKPLVDPIKSRWFNTVAFRQAVAYGINRDRILNTVYRGLGLLVNSPIIPQSPYYLPPEKGLRIYNYDPEKSKQLLLGAGFRYNPQGELLDSDGNRVEFNLLTNAGNTIREAMAAQIQQDLSKIGIKVNFEAIQFNVLIDKLDNTFDWDAYIIGFGGGLEPHSAANFWLPDGGSHNFNQKPGPNREPIEGREVAPWEARIGELYIQGSQELDEQKRREIYWETQRLTQENLPVIYLVTERIMAAVRDRVKGIRYPELGGALWNLYELAIQ